MFRIVCCAGIGDSVQNLCLFPHEFLHRTAGYRSGVIFIQFKIVEGESARGAGLAHAEFPSLLFFKSLVERCPSLRWRGEAVRADVVGRALNRGVREGLQLANGGEVRYFPFHPSLSEAELAALPDRGEGPLVGFQTHLTGMKTKRWGVPNWQRFLRLLLEARPDLRIVLFDAAPTIRELVVSERISTTVDFHIAQSIRLIPRLDLMVCIDSWTKYVAKAHGVEQIIVVPDQTPEYPELTGENLLKKHFVGLCDDPKITLVGFEPERRALTLPRMEDLQPEELVRRVTEKLNRSGLAERAAAGRPPRAG